MLTSLTVLVSLALPVEQPLDCSLPTVPSNESRAVHVDDVISPADGVLERVDFWGTGALEGVECRLEDIVEGFRIEVRRSNGGLCQPGEPIEDVYVPLAETVGAFTCVNVESLSLFELRAPLDVPVEAGEAYTISIAAVLIDDQEPCAFMLGRSEDVGQSGVLVSDDGCEVAGDFARRLHIRTGVEGIVTYPPACADDLMPSSTNGARSPEIRSTIFDPPLTFEADAIDVFVGAYDPATNTGVPLEDAILAIQVTITDVDDDTCDGVVRYQEYHLDEGSIACDGGLFDVEIRRLSFDLFEPVLLVEGRRYAVAIAGRLRDPDLGLTLTPTVVGGEAVAQDRSTGDCTDIAPFAFTLHGTPSDAALSHPVDCNASCRFSTLESTLSPAVAADRFVAPRTMRPEVLTWYGGGWDQDRHLPCDGSFPEFRIRIATTRFGLCGWRLDDIIWEQIVRPTRIPACTNNLGISVDRFATTLDVPPTLLEGEAYAIEIASLSGDPCLFCWQGSPIGQAISFHRDTGECSISPGGLAFSMTDVPCIADWNNDGIVNVFDVILFAQDIADEDPGVDLTDDGVIDADDLIEFLARFDAGC